MGRRKIEIKPIRDDRNRSVTFLKRKGGLFKKAHELSVLCSVDVAVVIFGHNKKLYEYSSSDINEIIARFQYYGGAHEHKGPQDFADKTAGDDDDDDDGGEDMGDEQGTPAPVMHPQMQNHPGFQHVRHGTPSGSPPMPNGAMPPFQRGPSPLPPGISRPSSRTSQHQSHRRTSSNLVPPPPQPNYAYQPNPPFYNPQTAAQMQQRQQQHAVPHQATYPPPFPSHNQQAQQAFLDESRRASMPPNFQPQAPPQANMHRNASHERLQPPQSHQQRHPSPQPQHQQHPSSSPQPSQTHFTSPPIPQPRPLPATKAQPVFTPIDDSRSMLAHQWSTTSHSSEPRPDASLKGEDAGPRSQSIDVASIQRPHANGTSPRPPKAMTPQPVQRTHSTPGNMPPSRSNTNQSDAKRPRLKVQIPSENSGDEATGSAPDEASATQAPNPNVQQQGQPSHGVVLPPPSPSAGNILSAGAQGPPNPFARPPPPMSTNPHAVNRDAANHIETPISALPSRFMSDNLLPSPSTFYPLDWNFGRSGDSGMLPSPLNFQTPIVTNGPGWREEDRKRGADESQDSNDPKRAKN